MIRFLTNIPPSVHLLLLVLIPLCRIPGFDGNFLLEEEALYLLLGQSILGEPQLYADAWFTGPPIMIWMYSFFLKLFGENALFAIRIFACFYIYLTAAYFNGILAEYKLFRKYVNLTSLMFVFLVSVPWYSQQFSASLFVLLPIIFSFHSLLQLGDNRQKNYRTMFQVGFWMMIAIMTSYKVLFILLGNIFAYIFLKNARLDEFTALIGGMMSVFGGLMLVMYLSGIFGEWWDIGFVSYLDRVMLLGLEKADIAVGDVLQSWISFWSALLILSIIGFLHFRLRFYSYVTKIRSIEMIMAVWLIGILFALGFKFSSLDTTDFILLVPPIVFYSAKTFEFKWVHRLRYVLLIAILIMPAYSYTAYLGIRFADSFSVLTPDKDDIFLHGGQLEFMNRQDPIFSLKDDPLHKDIWIMEFNPQLYIALDYPCANRYTDYRIAYYKVPSLPGGTERIFSRKETDRDVYEQFQNNPPDIVVDKKNSFPLLQARYPQLLSKYKRRSLGKYSIYEKVASRPNVSSKR
ncbi:MAG: hypothetical protein AAF696_17155 [Bacteroidota bacterium]